MAAIFDWGIIDVFRIQIGSYLNKKFAHAKETPAVEAYLNSP